MPRVVHEWKDGEWFQVEGHSFQLESSGRFVVVDGDLSGNWELSGFVSRESDNCVLLRTHPSRDAAMLAAEQWLEQQDLPQWIDLPSGLAAMCEWRGHCLMVADRGVGDPHFWFFGRTDRLDTSCAEATVHRNGFCTIESSKSAAEAWVRAQTGGIITT